MIRIFFKIYCFIVILYIAYVSADELYVLESRLKKNNNFFVNFIQYVIDINRNIIYRGEGELYFHLPNLFNLHIITPNESFLISNGNVFWFYDPIINQVTISNLNIILSSVPFLLLNNKLDVKDKFDITQYGDYFDIFPKCSNIYFNKITIHITNDGIIKNININKENGYQINYDLFNYEIKDINMNKFNFIPPNGVMCDDLRILLDK